ncbi:MAG TPA: hypothetical protein VLE49_17680 [Anaerolineales bacterium]|nr:hypothetical protein [Anaerolineales bacterium]
MSENINAVEMHGCIVCARTFNVLAVYTLDGKLVDCAVTSFGGHCVLGGRQPLVACDSHTAEEIETAHKRWQSRNGTELDEVQEDEKAAPNGP